MEEQIPDDPLECLEHPHFKKAQEHLRMRMLDIPRDKLLYLTDHQQRVWREAQPHNLHPQLTDTPKCEETFELTLDVGMFLDYEKRTKGVVTKDRKIVHLKLRPLLTKNIFEKLEDTEKLAVVRFVYAEREQELFTEYKKQLIKPVRLEALQERREKLQEHYQKVITEILGW